MYIYCLIDPRTKKVFYVGQTKDAHTRVIRHLQESLKYKYPKDFRISELVCLGMMPEIKILEEIDVEQATKKFETKTSEREKYWTDFYAKDNQLDNMQNNKSGMPEENKRKCLYCGKDYYAFSNKARYCSDTCRVYFNREKKFEKLANKLLHVDNEELKKTVADQIDLGVSITETTKDGVKRIDPFSEKGQELLTHLPVINETSEQKIKRMFEEQKAKFNKK